jgi:hypothetical protein
MKRLVAHLRVFFDKRSGKAERIEQFIAEHGIEYGLQFVTPFFPNSPNCLYLKKSIKFLQSYEKNLKTPYFCNKKCNPDTICKVYVKSDKIHIKIPNFRKLRLLQLKR